MLSASHAYRGASCARSRLLLIASAWAYFSGPRLQERRLGVFGSPTFVDAAKLYWGQDRTEIVDRALDSIRMRGE